MGPLTCITTGDEILGPKNPEPRCVTVTRYATLLISEFLCFHGSMGVFQTIKYAVKITFWNYLQTIAPQLV